MSRDFQIQGPAIVRVRGGEHWSGGAMGSLTELGMCSEPIKIELVRFYRRIGADDFGPNASVDTMWNLGECVVRMKLIHFDPFVLRDCLSDSMAGGGDLTQIGVRFPGVDLRAAGSLLGNGLPRLASGNYYVSVNVSSPNDFNANQWRFFTCYLSEQPVIHKIGCEANVAELVWKAIPYVPIYVSGSYTATKSSTTNSPGELYLLKINQGTNNGPEWVPQTDNIQTPTFIEGFVTDADAPPVAGVDPAADNPEDSTVVGVTYTVRKEILSSGTMLWDHGRDD